MKFRVSDEQAMLRDTVRRFAARELAPAYLRQIDANAAPPHRSLLPRMAALGFTALPVPLADGGLGGSTVDATLMLEELGRASLTAASILDSAIGFGFEMIKRLGSPAQKRELFEPLVRGEMCFAFSPAQSDADADAAVCVTRATTDGDGFIIDGAALLTPAAGEARCLIVAAGMGADLRLFAVNPRSAGIRMRRIETLGMRAAGGLYEVDYERVRVPAGALLGSGAAATATLLAACDRARTLQAAWCIGCAQQAIDDAVRYGGEREQFGQPIGRFQAIAHLLVDLQVDVDAARCLLYRAAWAADEGLAGPAYATLANIAATEALLRVTSDAMRVDGGYGLTMEFDIQRHFRDARSLAGAGGTVHLQRDAVAQAMGL